MPQIYREFPISCSPFVNIICLCELGPFARIRVLLLRLSKQGHGGLKLLNNCPWSARLPPSLGKVSVEVVPQVHRRGVVTYTSFSDAHDECSDHQLLALLGLSTLGYPCW